MKKLIIASILFVAACSSSSEAPRVSKPVVASAALPAAFTNDEGWTIEFESASVAITDVTFTTQGESHTASLWRRLGDAVIRPAYAHPGHLAGGEAIGELPGTHVVELGSGAELGVATLIVGRYDGANFTFVQHDELAGASLELAGTATRDDLTVEWTASIIQDADRTVVGVPMDVDLTDDVDALEVELLAVDPTDAENTLFDGIDFGAEAVLQIEPTTENGARLLRTTQRHDFWRVRVAR